MNCLNDYRLNLKGKELVPLVVGGMGTNISTAELVLAVEKLGGIAHLSDAMLPDVADRELGTRFTADKTIRWKSYINNPDKTDEKFDLDQVAEISKKYFTSAMEKATGKGLVLVNCMEKLTMNEGINSLRVRLNSALDAGVDGITLAAGLHLSSFKLMAENKRFHDAALGIIVSSARALTLFLKRTASTGRLPDYVIVEGPLAGGHLGFGEDWKDFRLENIVQDVKNVIAKLDKKIPVLAAGGIFTGGDATRFVEEVGADGVQVATRFTISKESGLPEKVKQIYIDANPEDVEVNHFSPTGYLMRMLKSSPAISSEIRPNCEPYGYMLSGGKCSYLTEWYARKQENGESVPHTKCCLCTHMRNYKVWTCGVSVSRLKETTIRKPDGTWLIPSAEHIFNDYCFSKGDEILLPQL